MTLWKPNTPDSFDEVRNRCSVASWLCLVEAYCNLIQIDNINLKFDEKRRKAFRGRCYDELNVSACGRC